MYLDHGSHVVIVGGGPSGSFSALHLQRYAAEANISLNITILEGRDFSQPGPGGCNKCAGILSANLLKNIEEIGLQIPPDVVQSEIFTYILHIDGTPLLIHRPDPNHRILSVYRGSGPRLGGGPSVASFDAWLLDQAQQAGAKVWHERVQSIRPGERPVVKTAHQEFSADLVVLATGVNARLPLDPSWGYKPPLTEIMAQDEVLLPEDYPNDRVEVFVDHPLGLIFGALIPKGSYANISLLGHRLPPNAVESFLEGNGLVDLIPGGVPRLCGCAPRVSVSRAVNFYADRLVVVGDAAVTRLYKDGVGAAFITAQAAARTAIRLGVSREAFAAGYDPVCRHIASDNRYGRVIFRLWSINRQSPFLAHAWVRAIQAETDPPPAKGVHTRVLWSMFTGSESYRQLFWLSVSWRALVSILKGAWLNWRNR